MLFCIGIFAFGADRQSLQMKMEILDVTAKNELFLTISSTYLCVPINFAEGRSFFVTSQPGRTIIE